ncbi:helix-turn-helix transcriptional regulator [Clostridium ljungdahlii]|uniref:HTH domain protein n=1 Tax=Clostridium ljungdahlii TaxID=1538 RepID=A0A168MMA3_9CLOT|nr:YafY family protein [Clostridium ljungdahlii]OAA84893.1 HTH domain protein [Clostridium ljungdahlii]
MSKISNLLEIIIMLQYKGLTTASELSEILEVDKKTIYRYIRNLNEASVPIYTIKGRNGGFYIDQNFYIKPSNLSENELEALLMAEEILTSKNGFVYEKDLKNAIFKVKSINVNKNKDLSKINSNKNFSINYVGSMENLEDKISKINYSMSRGRSLSINYFSVNKNNLTMRKIDPYDLIFKEGDWYIIGYCHMKGDIRSFKLNRVKNLKISKDIYMRPHTFSLKEYLDKNWGIFMGDKIKVVIKFSEKEAAFIKDTTWHIHQHIDQLKGGKILFTIYLNELEDIKKWILSFGKNAEVIEPIELRKNIKKELEELYKRY